MIRYAKGKIKIMLLIHYQQSGTTTVKSLILLCESVTAVEGTKSYVVVRPQKWLIQTHAG